MWAPWKERRWRRLAVVGGGTAAALVAVAVVLAALSGGASTARHARRLGSIGAPGDWPAARCVAAPMESAVRVTLYGGGERGCASFAREAAYATGEPWRVSAGTPPTAALACWMERGRSLIEVGSSGGRLYAESICVRLAAAGWREIEGMRSSSRRGAREAARERAARARTAPVHAGRGHREATAVPPSRRRPSATGSSRGGREAPGGARVRAGGAAERRRREAQSRRRENESLREQARRRSRLEVEELRANKQARRAQEGASGARGEPRG
jgi:hypothetical protein